MSARRLAFVASLVLALGSLSGCREEVKQAPPPAVVLVALAAPAAGSEAMALAGEVRSRYETDLAFRMGGKLVARPVDVGAVVKAGQVLARLDPADLQLNATAVRAQVDAAESDLALAKAEMDRYAALAREKFVSQAVLDAKTTAHQAAQARLGQARALSAVSGNQAGYGVLTAERAEVVTAVYAEPGQVVAAGQRIVRTARPDSKEILVQVPENRLAAFSSATDFSITFFAQPDVRLSARLRELAPVADPAARTYAARLRLQGDATAVQLGMTAQVSVPESGVVSGVAVPLSAVIDRGQGPEVWRVVQGKAERRPVKVAAYKENQAILSAGVGVGDAVVAVGAHKLFAGQAVQPKPMP